jgi:hypothetical protein
MEKQNSPTGSYKIAQRLVVLLTDSIKIHVEWIFIAGQLF